MNIQIFLLVNISDICISIYKKGLNFLELTIAQYNIGGFL